MFDLSLVHALLSKWLLLIDDEDGDEDGNDDDYHNDDDDNDGEGHIPTTNLETTQR